MGGDVPVDSTLALNCFIYAPMLWRLRSFPVGARRSGRWPLNRSSSGPLRAGHPVSGVRTITTYSQTVPHGARLRLSPGPQANRRVRSDAPRSNGSAPEPFFTACPAVSVPRQRPSGSRAPPPAPKSYKDAVDRVFDCVCQIVSDFAHTFEGMFSLRCRSGTLSVWLRCHDGGDLLRSLIEPEGGANVPLGLMRGTMQGLTH
jgi:hypothetical protein